MVFHTEWLDEPYILKTKFEENTSVGELNLVMLEYLGAAQAQEIYFLLDFSEVIVPNDVLKLPSLLQVINHANTKWVGIVKAESASSYMTRLLTRDKVKTFHKTDMAIGFLRGMVRLETGTKLPATV